ncbi:cob(I)yrinic acid a,c-diamide adenosyltransferase [Robertmurraya sp. DFI.2.37]|uniref:cob(I)yrinic acid a,c-diamide adenosyltransferase n=1 Tax=Robertmurraya sp. DFI.2.37 TaxID=3031819 RepID=UPI0012479574|nr:cob(I)yrinic acid a,c-diamide adenosyltransferase [Robertmurraya sp. DFI.2.37]MDF1507158.1 cob(I)yrinic acid a,c-diamide adenosyltransferase [Robertmurraya sp. DFI.2.37]
MAIYTKKGDKGETGLLGGSRISKDSLKVSCYGTLDEANAALGVAFSQIANDEMKSIIREIQKQLFVVGAELASDEKGKDLLTSKISEKEIAKFEEIIDKFEQIMGPIHEFIIPGDTSASANLHLSRAIIRRAERLIVELAKTSIVRSEVIQYVNRLSDLLFMLARAEVYYCHIEEIKTKVIGKLKALKGSDAPFCLSLQLASAMAQAAEKKAMEIGVPVVISIVDSAGHAILLHRMENSLLASLELALNKAYTSVALKMATHELVPIIQPGTELYGIQMTNQKIVTFGGGYPLKLEEKVIGGIGVSGGTVEEDMVIATEATAVFLRMKEGY